MAYSTTPWRLLIAASMLVLPAVLAASGGYTGRVDLIHVDANGGFTREELMRRAADRSYLRATMLAAAAAPADGSSSTTPRKTTRVDANFSHYEYMMAMEVDIAGSSTPLRFMAVADTGSGFVWTKKQMSSFLEAVPCSCTRDDNKNKLYAFNMTYGNGYKAAKGFMCAQQTLSFLPLPLPSSKTQTKKTGLTLGFALHCDEHLLPVSADGIVGLNRAGLSLIKQLHVANFSYCLSNPLIDSAQLPGSPFWFGSTDPPLSLGDLQSTRLVNESDTATRDRYHVELVGITVGHGNYADLTKNADLFRHKSEKDPEKGVLFIDSGCSHSFLETKVFEKLKDLLVGQLGTSESVTKDDKVHTCFPAPAKKPALLLHFKDDAQMEIPWENYMLQDELAKKAGQFCLAINETAGVSILGNILQHNIYMQYDLTNEKLWFKQVPDCSNL